MAHPIDQIAAQYTKKVDELQNVNRQLKSFEALQQQKATLEQELSDLRGQMGQAHAQPAEAIDPAGTTADVKPNQLKQRFEKSPRADQQ